MKSIFLSLLAICLATISNAQDDNCSFNMYDGSPELEINTADYPYVKEEDWSKDKYDELDLVYSVFCEEMFKEATKHIHEAYASASTLHVIERIGHTENYEMWDVVLRSESKTYHIHFQFELMMEEE